MEVNRKKFQNMNDSHYAIWQEMKSTTIVPLYYELERVQGKNVLCNGIFFSEYEYVDYIYNIQ